MSWRLAVQAGSAALRAPDTGLPDARRWGRAGLTTLGGLIVAVLVAVLAFAVTGRLHAPWPSAVRNDLVALATSVIAVLALGLAAWRRWARWALPVSWVLLSGLASVPLALALVGTRYYFGGVSVDQNFRTAYLTRMASSPAVADFAYRGLPPYYPSTWFWLGGRFANLAGLPGWAAYKPWALVTFAVVAILTYELWALVTARRTAFVLALATTAVGIALGADEPYSWLLSAVVPPLAVLVWLWVSAVVAGETTRGTVAGMVALGVAVGVFGDLYTLHMGFLALVAVLLGVLAVVRARAGFVRLLWRYAVAAVIALVVMAPVWGPYLLAALGGDPAGNLALRYLPRAGATVPLPMLEFSVTGAACLLGAVWLVLQARRSAVAAALATTAATVYLWFGVSFAVLALRTTLLPFRLTNLLTTVLVCAAVPAALGLGKMAVAWLQSRATELRVLACLLGFGFLLATVQGAAEIAHTNPKTFSDYYPTGSNAMGRADHADQDSWVPQLRSAVAALTHRAPQDNILLSNQLVLDVTTPYWAYQAPTPHYANPLARFADRNAQILSWSKITDPARMAAALDTDRFPAPTAFVFLRAGGGLTLKVSDDIFPAEPNVHRYPVSFSPSAFAGPQFVRRDVGPYTVIARTAR